jgi:hypothetical protein
MSSIVRRRIAESLMVMMHAMRRESMMRCRLPTIYTIISYKCVINPTRRNVIKIHVRCIPRTYIHVLQNRAEILGYSIMVRIIEQKQIASILKLK